jgi:hypothetical protein
MSLTATENTWNREFVGEAADTLWSYIENNFDPQNAKFYGHYTSIVQSSGMGKSRTVDELSKSHFVIPLNLRSADSTGIKILLFMYAAHNVNFDTQGILQPTIPFETSCPGQPQNERVMHLSVLSLKHFLTTQQQSSRISFVM